MKKSLRNFGLAFVIAILVCSASVAASDNMSRTAIVEQHSTSTLTFLTVLPGETLAKIAAGQTVKLGTLSDESKVKILDAAKTVIGRSYEVKFSEQNDINSFALLILTDFTVTIRGGALGSESDIHLQLTKDLMGIYKHADSMVTDIPTLPNPPAFENIMVAAPSDQVERANYLRLKAVSILDGVGNFRLKKAEIPVSLSRFTSNQTVKLLDLSDPEKTWLSGVYRDFCLRAIETGQKIKLTKVEGKATFDGVPSEWLSKAPPAWSELGDVSVEFNVQYMPVIAPLDKPSCDKGGGWSLPKYGAISAQ